MRISWKPPKLRLGEHDLDYLELELGDDGVTEFGLQLGKGLMIYRAMPIAPNERWRLIVVDSAVVDVDVEIVEDPFVCEVARQVWRPNDETLVMFEASGGGCVVGTHRTLFAATP